MSHWEGRKEQTQNTGQDQKVKPSDKTGELSGLEELLMIKHQESTVKTFWLIFLPQYFSGHITTILSGGDQQFLWSQDISLLSFLYWNMELLQRGVLQSSDLLIQNINTWIWRSVKPGHSMFMAHYRLYNKMLGPFSANISKVGTQAQSHKAKLISPISPGTLLSQLFPVM